MRKLYPFVGIAVAVAGGLALAPYFWWLVGMAGIVGGAYWVRREYPRASVIVIALVTLLAWPVWLLWRGQPTDALFVLALLLVIGFWKHIVAFVGPRMSRIFPD